MFGVQADLVAIVGEGTDEENSASSALPRSRAAVEAAQLFTISHVADLRDLTWAWMCCLIGAALAWLVATCCPNLHRRPLTVMRGLVLIVACSLLVWATASMYLAGPDRPSRHDALR